MQSRRDQLQAYRFLIRRALAALVTGEPDAADPPMRRLTLTTFSGIMIAVLVAAGFGVYGLIKPGSGDNWKKSGAVVIERETGASYVYYDDKLHPTVNYASAVLAAGSKKQPSVEHVNRSDLAGTPRTPLIGITGLPSSLPSKDDLVDGPWTVCSQITERATDSNLARVTVTVGSDNGAARLEPDEGVVVATPGRGREFVLWHGQRLQVASAEIASSLGLNSGSSQVLTVGTAFLDALPQGTPLRAPRISGKGGRYRQKIDGKTALVGQLLDVTDQHKFAVVLGDGVHDVSPVQAALIRAEQFDGEPLAPLSITETTELTLAQSSAGWAALSQQFDGLPQRFSTFDGSSAQHGGVCALYSGGAGTPALAASGGTAPLAGKVSESANSSRGHADAVTVAPGHAAIVEATNGSPTQFIVAEPGLKFPVGTPSADILTAFGYGSVKPVRLPAQLLLMLPTGPAFDPTQARTPVSG